jgi:predicted DNA-binding transcriptional regulator AlpA
MDEGKFPKPYSLGARSVAWLEADVTTWIESRVNAGQVVK